MLQQAVADRRVRVRKVVGTVNPADILTKYLAFEPAARMTELLGVKLEWRPGGKRAGAEEGCGD